MNCFLWQIGMQPPSDFFDANTLYKKNAHTHTHTHTVLSGAAKCYSTSQTFIVACETR